MENRQNIRTVKIKNIRDLKQVCDAYLGIKCGLQRMDAEDGQNRISYKLNVGWKQNPQFNPGLDLSQIFKGDVAINNYLEKNFGSNWPESATNEVIDKCILIAKKKGLDTDRVRVEINQAKPKSADIRILFVKPMMLAEELINSHLAGIKKSLAEKEMKQVDKDITGIEKKKVQLSDDEVARLLESGDYDVEDEGFEDEADEIGFDDDSEENEIGSIGDNEMDTRDESIELPFDEPGQTENKAMPVGLEERIEDMLNPIIDGLNDVNKFITGLSARIENLEKEESEPKKKTGRPAKK